MDNWYVVLGLVALVIALGVAGYKFLGLPKEEKFKKIKVWLLAVVIEAEKIYGSKTGQAKLSYVYGQFKQQFPFLANILTFDAFSKIVDSVLDEMKTMLETNKELKEYTNIE